MIKIKNLSQIKKHRVIEEYKDLCGVYSLDDHKKAIQAINKAKGNLLLVNPFFGYLLTKQKITEASKWLPTAAVDGKHLFFNVGFILKLNVFQIQFLICHELLHLIYNHIARTYYPNGLPRNNDLFNIANDYIVNADSFKCVSRDGYSFDLPPGVYIDKRFNNMVSEDIYTILLKEIIDKIKEQEQEQKSKENQDDDSSNSSSSSNSSNFDNELFDEELFNDGLFDDEMFDSNNKNPAPSNSNSKESDSSKNQDKEKNKQDEKSLSDKISDMIEELYGDNGFDVHLDLESGTGKFDNDKVSVDENGNLSLNEQPTYSDLDISMNLDKFKGDIFIAKDFIDSSNLTIGNMPIGVLRAIKELTEPSLNWRRFVRKAITSLKTKKLSWAKPNRRSFDSNIIMPSKIKKPSYKIHISVDSSGSVDDNMLADFLSEIVGGCKQLGHVEVTIWSFDGSIHNVKKYNDRNMKDLKDYKVFGNGGTSFLINWDYMIENKIKPDLFMMFTDGGYCDAPGIAGYCQTLYIIPEHLASNVDIEKKYGKIIPYKKDRKTKNKV